MEKIIKGLKKKEHIDLVKKIFNSNQEHVLEFWHELDEIKREKHLDDLSKIDFDIMKELIQKHIEKPELDKKKREISPVPIIKLNDKNKDKARDIGINALKNREVAVFVVAGGQGSRLGYDGPKGKFLVIGYNLVPYPAHSIIAFIVQCLYN